MDKYEFEYENKEYEVDEEAAIKNDRLILPDGKILQINWGGCSTPITFTHIGDVQKGTDPAEAAKNMGYPLATIVED